MIWHFEELIAKPYLIISWVNIGLPLWLYFDNYYKIDDEYLHYRFGYNKGKIRINSICEIKKSRIMRQGQQNAGIASHGLSLQYNKFDEIFICPKKEQEFIEALVGVNPEIEVSVEMENTDIRK